MPIKVKCRCGRVLKVRDSMAGKRVRCPECESPIRIPEPEPVYEEFDDYVEEEDDPYAAPPPPRKRKKKSSGKKSGRKRSKTSGASVPVPLLIGGGIFAGLIGLGGAAYVFLSRDSPQVAETGAPGPSGSSAGTTQANSSGSGASSAPGQEITPGEPADPTTFWSGGADFSEESTEPASTDASSTSSSTAATPVSTPSAGGGLWVVLSGFRETTPPGSTNKTYQVDYKVASGTPAAGQSYVLYVGSPMGMMERYNEVDINLTTNGTVEVPGGIVQPGRTKAYVALRRGPRTWKAVSGELKVGGPPTAAQRPPTVAEAIGTSAQGKLIGLTNARFEDSRGRKALVVDYILQQPADLSNRYFLVVSGNGDPVTADVSQSLMRAREGQASQFGLRLLPTRSFPKGNLTIHVERQIGMFRRNNETPEIVSNSTTLNR